MVTKGLDFDNVFLVGILDADMLLNRPDFRAYERSYQLMSQVAGRAGRQGKQGKLSFRLVIQIIGCFSLWVNTTMFNFMKMKS
jgi:primosomal protein N'